MNRWDYPDVVKTRHRELDPDRDKIVYRIVVLPGQEAWFDALMEDHGIFVRQDG